MSIDFMAISKISDSDFDEALTLISQSTVDVIYLVDSFSTYYSEQIRKITDKFRKNSIGDMIPLLCRPDS